jgi:hypothetical protein
VLPGGWREAFLRTHAACQQVLNCTGWGWPWYLLARHLLWATACARFATFVNHKPWLVLMLPQHFWFCSCAARRLPAGSGPPTRRQ